MGWGSQYYESVKNFGFCSECNGEELEEKNCRRGVP